MSKTTEATEVPVEAYAPFTIVYDPSAVTLTESKSNWLLGAVEVEAIDNFTFRLIKNNWYIDVNREHFIKAVLRWQQESHQDFVAGQTEIYVVKSRNGFVEVHTPTAKQA